MNHVMKLRPTYFDMIADGTKIYEIRLNDEKRQLVQVGDIITFQREPELAQTCTTIVTELLHFDTFNQMASKLPLAKVGFANMTPDEVVEIYHQFYTPENEQKYGVLAIKVENIK